jgi:O-antigen biosynthesis protein
MNGGRMTPAREPVRLVEAELSRPLPWVRPEAGNGRGPYAKALCLVRLHGVPLGLVPFELGSDGVDPAACAAAIWRALSREINAHLAEDGLPLVSELRPSGITADHPRCVAILDDLLADPPRVSVVVATRDRPHTLRRCLESLFAVVYPLRFEIVVVDNAPSSTATLELVGRLSRAELRYVREDRPGPSWARNRGLAEASSDLVVFLDDDVVADRRLIAALVGGFNAAEDVGCVTGLILPTELETPAQLLVEEYGGYNKGFEQRIFDTGEHRPEDPLYPFTAGRFGAGACMAFRRSVFLDLGGFDPTLGSGRHPTGGEELSAFLRVVRSGRRLVYTPSAIVRHAHHRDYDRLRKQLHGYGVGLGAYLTSCIASEPRLALEFALRLPRAARYMVDGRSEKNRRKSCDYPRELTRTELAGLLAGPFAYVRARSLARRIEAEAESRSGRPVGPQPRPLSSMAGRV